MDLQDIILNLLGFIGGEPLSAIGENLMPFAENWLGLDEKDWWTTPFINGGTNAGLNRMLGRGRVSAESKMLANRLREMQKFNYLKRSYQSRYKGKSNAFYNAKAAGFMSNMFTDAMFDMMDPNNFEEAAGSIRDMYRNLASPAMRRRGLKASAQAGYIMNNLFLDANGNMDFNRDDYNGFTLEGVAKIGSYITKGTDLMDGIGDDMSIGKLRDATRKLRTRIQDMTKALEPMRDIFGTDIKSMIMAVESLAGVSLRQLTPDAAASLVRSFSAETETGRFNMAQLAAVQQVATSQLYKAYNGDALVRDAGGIISMRIAAAMSDTGTVPLGMTDASYKNEVSNTIAKAAASNGAELVGRAYAKWKADTRNANRGMHEFRKEVSGKLAGGATVVEALLGVSGARGTSELAQYAFDSAVSEARREGLTTDIAFEGNLEEQYANVALGVSSDAYRTLSRGGLNTRKARLEALKRAREEILKDSSILVRYKDVYKEDAGMLAMFDYLNNDVTGKRYAAGLSALAETMKQREEVTYLKQMDEIANQSEKGTQGSIGEAFWNLVQNNFAFSDMIDAAKKAQEKLLVEGTQEQRAELAAMAAIAGSGEAADNARMATARKVMRRYYGSKKLRSSVALRSLMSVTMNESLGMDAREAAAKAFRSIVLNGDLDPEQLDAFMNSRYDSYIRAGKDKSAANAAAAADIQRISDLKGDDAAAVVSIINNLRSGVYEGDGTKKSQAEALVDALNSGGDIKEALKKASGLHVSKASVKRLMALKAEDLVDKYNGGGSEIIKNLERLASAETGENKKTLFSRYIEEKRKAKNLGDSTSFAAVYEAMDQDEKEKALELYKKALVANAVITNRGMAEGMDAYKTAFGGNLENAIKELLAFLSAAWTEIKNWRKKEG